MNIGHLLLDYRQDDIFLASYPRSGNTWLRTILTYILAHDSEFSPELRAKVVPGVSIRNASNMRRLPSPRLIKTHSWYRTTIPAAVYLTRDGRDVLVSIYHYLITRRGKNQDFDDFFEKYLAGFYGQKWHENVESWLTKGKTRLDDRIQIVKFEHMKENTYMVVEEVINFMGISASPETIKNAIRQSSMDKMREIERQRKGVLLDANQSFYRGGLSGEWQSIFSTKQNTRFLEVSKHALELADYIP